VTEASQKCQVSVIVLTYNEEKCIRETLESLAWCDDVWIVDSYSTDRTLDICREYTDHTVQHKFENFSIQRNWALENLPLASDWVLFIDAAETVSPELRKEILTRVGKEDGIVGYYVPRKQILWGKWLRHGGFWPSYRLILFHRDHGRFLDREVHEWAVVDGPTGYMQHSITNIFYESAEKMVRVLNYCTTAEALRMYRMGNELFTPTYQSSRWKNQLLKTIFSWLPCKPLFTFLLHYVVYLGFLDGRRGLVWAVTQAYYVFLAYFKLWELKHGFSDPPEDLIWRKKE
jgi:glycosyltransferase involved in cell wall biosynthesis